MTTTTLKIDPTDRHEDVTVQAGGAAGTKGINLVIDNSKFTNQAQLVAAITRLREVVTKGPWPLPAS